MEITWDTNADGEHETKVHSTQRVCGGLLNIKAVVSTNVNGDGWYWEVVTDSPAGAFVTAIDGPICLFWEDSAESLEVAKRHAAAALVALVTGDFPRVQVAP